MKETTTDGEEYVVISDGKTTAGCKAYRLFRMKIKNQMKCKRCRKYAYNALVKLNNK